MKINNLRTLAFSALLAASFIGSFSESAEARRTRFSGNSNTKEGTNNSVLADFILDTDKGVIESFTAIEDANNPLLNVSSPLGKVTPSEFTGSDLGNLEDILGALGITAPIEFDSDSVIKYDLTFDGLPNYNGTLFISYRTSVEKDSLTTSLTGFDNAFTTNPQIRNDGIPGIIIRNYIPTLDTNQKITINGVDRAVDFFGVADTGSTFIVTEIKDIPEPTTTVGLLATVAIGGLSLRKRQMKSKAIISKKVF